MAILHMCDLCGKVIEGTGMATSIKLTGYRETFHSGIGTKNLQPENHLLTIDHAHEACVQAMMQMVRDIPNKLRGEAVTKDRILRMGDYRNDQEVVSG